MRDVPDTTELIADAIVETAKEWDGRIDSWTALELAKDAIETYTKAIADQEYKIDARTEPTADALVGEILSIQKQCNPDSGPGDITIEIQDDSALVTLSQDTEPGLSPVGFIQGSSIVDVLRKKLEEVRG